MSWNIYLAGEIHSDWRESIADGVKAAGLDVELLHPNTHHQSSDDCGVHILGDEGNPFWKDHKAATINAIRNRKLIHQADLVVVKFGEKYRQWNAAFDAGVAVTLGKPLVVIHPKEFGHALKEIDSAAAAVVEDDEQVIEIIRYLIRGELI